MFTSLLAPGIKPSFASVCLTCSTGNLKHSPDGTGFQVKKVICGVIDNCICLLKDLLCVKLCRGSLCFANTLTLVLVFWTKDVNQNINETVKTLSVQQAYIVVSILLSVLKVTPWVHVIGLNE